MPTRNLKPSEIFYSQATISGHFGRGTRHKHQDIGNTLDALYYGRISIRDIPTISVVKKDDKWVTLDNRRLWLFHHLQGAGKCNTISVNEIEYYECLSKHSRKFTSNNGGTSVSFSHRNGSGGKCYRFITPVKPQLPTITVSETASSETVSVKKTKPSKAQSSTTSTNTTVHPYLCMKPIVNNISVKHENVEIADSMNRERDKLLISKGVYMLKKKLIRQQELKRLAHKTLWGSNHISNNRRTCYTRLPHRHHFILKKRDRYNHVICRHSENNSMENCDDIFNEESEEETSECVYTSYLDADIDNAGSDEDDMDKDYEDEPHYFYEFEDSHANFDTFKTISAVTDTSADESKNSDDDDDDESAENDKISDNNDFSDTNDLIEHEDINAYDNYCFENELWPEMNIQTLNKSSFLSDDDTDSDEQSSEDDDTNYGEDEEENEESDTRDNEAVHVQIINSHFIRECTLATPFRKQKNKDDKYQNEDKWFYDCFDNCYRRVKK